MRGVIYVAMIGALASAAAGRAQGGAGDVAAANARIRAANDAIARDGANRLAAWEKERARVAMENDASKAAYAQAREAYAPDMANWRAGTARLAQATPASAPAATRDAPGQIGKVPAGGKRVCRTETVTGSLVQKRKVCATAAERDDRARAAQGTLRVMTSGSCVPGTSC